jgi:hypothetical protein
LFPSIHTITTHCTNSTIQTMKKHFLLSTSLVLALAFGAKGQFPIAKGTKMVELAGELGGVSTKKTASSDIVIKLKGGLFIRENLMVGILLIPVFRNADLGGGLEGKGRGFTGGVLARRYFPLGKNFALLAQGLLEAGYNNGSTQTGNPNTRPLSTRNTFAKISAVAGVSYFINPHLGISTDFDVAGLRYDAVKVGDGKPVGALGINAISKVPAFSVRFTYLF